MYFNSGGLLVVLVLGQRIARALYAKKTRLNISDSANELTNSKNVEDAKDMGRDSKISCENTQRSLLTDELWFVVCSPGEAEKMRRVHGFLPPRHHVPDRANRRGGR
jgi:hypothetical protein